MPAASRPQQYRGGPQGYPPQGGQQGYTGQYPGPQVDQFQLLSLLCEGVKQLFNIYCCTLNQGYPPSGQQGQGGQAPGGYAASGAPQGYGGPPPTQQTYGAPPPSSQQPAYGPPPSGQQGYGPPPPSQQPPGYDKLKLISFL